MEHLGDITKINGAEAPLVDCIIGGSPCQDLSVAGKRAGLAGARSGLFMDQIRVIKEQRNESRKNGARGVAIRPRYMVWENVPGAFSSNGGDDFRVVLEEVARVSDEGITIPRPAKGKWQNAGVILGDGYSIAWRVLDAQYWGVPQRRRRIALVADFGGESASEILFEQKIVSGNSKESREKRKKSSTDTQASTGESVLCFEGGAASRLGGYCWEDVAPTLRTEVGDNRPTVCIQGAGKTSKTSNGDGYKEEVAYTLNTVDVHGVCYSKVRNAMSPEDYETWEQSDTAHTINTFNASISRASDVVVQNKSWNDIVGALCAGDTKGPASNQYVDQGKLQVTNSIVRGLTPLECERLQGYPDGWTDIGEWWVDSKGKVRKTSDSARYKAMGNSIALPPWKWVIKRICSHYERDATMASLFDGVGGFPLIWEQINGPGSCLWASEIEEFPIAVTKKRFKQINTGE